MLEKVKANLGITGTYQDNTIQGYIDEVKQFLIDGGVSEAVVNSDASIGIISRGVEDLWNYGAGEGKLSEYFIQRAIQLRYKKDETNTFIKYIKDYFYEMLCKEVDYEYAYKYFKDKKPITTGACSSVRNGNWFGRNYDWTYDDNAEFLVRTPKVDGRYASIAIAGGINGLTNEIVKSQINSPLYKILPFCLLDGINEKGVVINTNVVPIDKGITTKTVPAISEEVEMCSIMLVRYVLDHFATAKEAAEYIRDHTSVYMPTTILNMNYETHYMIADENKTYLVEFIGNNTVIREMDKPYMTNFYLTDVIFNDDGKVYTPKSVGHFASENNITDNGSGLERYNIIVDNYESTNSKVGMRELMNKLIYTNAYKNNDWLTEFVGDDGLTVNSSPDDFVSVMSYAKGLYDNRSRNGTIWQTTHSVVYDIANRKAYVITQEDGQEYEYKLEVNTSE